MEAKKEILSRETVLDTSLRRSLERHCYYSYLPYILRIFRGGGKIGVINDVILRSKEYIMSPIQSGLLSRATVSFFLQETRDCLKDSAKNRKALQVIYDLDEMIGETRCCIYDWTRLSQLYRSSQCQLERALVFLEDLIHCKEVKCRIREFESAHAAVKPFVLEFLRGNDSEEKWLELGC